MDEPKALIPITGASDDLPDVGASNPTVASMPYLAASAVEIQKPRDWQAYERLSVLLFKAVLNDQRVQTYGRSGQNQEGLDLIGYKDGRLDQMVSVQCRKIEKPLKEAKIREDALKTLQKFPEVCEIIFATTAPNDTKATDAAINLQRELLAQGKSIRITVYGWDHLQDLVSQFPDVRRHWQPSFMAAPSAAPSTLAETKLSSMEVTLSEIRDRLQRPQHFDAEEASNVGGTEDPALHAKIDSYRDLLNDGETEIGLKRLEALLPTIDKDALPWATSRVYSNIGKAKLDLGHYEDAAANFETAHSLRPDDSKAVANLALAQMLRGSFAEAIPTAQAALQLHPAPVHAVGYLLQAAARSEWEGDPLDLIPPEYADSEEAAIGLGEFKRIRSIPGWHHYSIEQGRSHPESKPLKRMAAFAILSALTDDHPELRTELGDVTPAEISAAASDLKISAEAALRFETIDADDAIATIHNAAVLLKFSDRFDESERLLRQGIEKYGPVDPMVRLLALLVMLNDRVTEAVQLLDTLPATSDAQLMAVELLMDKEPAKALIRLEQISVDVVDERHSEMRLVLMAEIATRLRDDRTFERATNKLRQMGVSPVLLELTDFFKLKAAGAEEEELQRGLTEISGHLTPQDSLWHRFHVAEQLRINNLPVEASRVLEGHVDLSRINGAARFYIECLAIGRRDNKYAEALDQLAPNFRDDPGVLWIEAQHSYEIGDFPRGLKAVERLIATSPTFKAKMLRVELLIRLDETEALNEALSHPLEDEPRAKLSDLVRLVTLLGHFGHRERSAKLAYRLYLSNRDNSSAWMALMGAVFQVGRPAVNDAPDWAANTAEPNFAVDVTIEDEPSRFFVIEPDRELRKLDADSLEPSHELCEAVLGKAKDDLFELPDGRIGVIDQIRHKYVARTHSVVEEHERRFPTIMGVRRYRFEPGVEDGLDEVKEQCRLLREHQVEELQEYEKTNWPLRVLAIRLGMDTIDATAAVAAEGILLKVDPGTPNARSRALLNVTKATNGAVIDLAAFWAAWKLGALDMIIKTVGPLTVTRSTFDRLRARLERLDSHRTDGMKTMGFRNGDITLRVVEADEIEGWHQELEAAIRWIEANAEIAPVRAADTLNDQFRKALLEVSNDMIDDLIVAHEKDKLLISDDGPYRDVGNEIGVRSTWLYPLFLIALRKRRLSPADFTLWTANLSDAGHHHLGITEGILFQAVIRDMETEPKTAGWTFKAIAKQIGGRQADRESHLRVVMKFLELLWYKTRFIDVRASVTGLLLNRLLSERTEDYQDIFSELISFVPMRSSLYEYLKGWAVGHFMPLRSGSAQLPSPRQ